MKTTVEEISPVKRRLTVELEPEEVTSRIEDAYRALKKKAKVHGFRPGKAPREILERHYGEQVAEDVTRGIVSETLPVALEESKIYPLTMPRLENEVLKKGEPFKYAAVMEIRPSFELKDYTGLDVEKEIVSLSDDEVERHLEEIRKANAHLKPLEEDRGVRGQDCVLVDYEAFEGGKPVEEIKAQNFLVRMGTAVIHPDFEKGLLGLKPGAEKEIPVDFDEHHQNAKLAGKKVTFKVKVTDIKVLELPELNDDFAASLGGEFKSLEDLRKRIREDLLSQEEKRVNRELKRRLLDKISATVDFDLPDSLVEAELRYAVQNVRQQFQRMGTSFEKAGVTEEKIREDFTAASRKRVKDLLILGEIASRNNLAVSEEELNRSLDELAVSIGQEPSVVRRYYQEREMMEPFREKLLEEKTLNFLVEGAKITPVEASRLSPMPSAPGE